MEKILVTGAGGMVGHYLSDEFSGAYELCLTDKDGFDVTDIAQAKRFLDTSWKAVIHLAAETNLESCEKDPAMAYMVNTIGVANALEISRKLDIPFVYISTAGVFDGSKSGAYVETDMPNPLNPYGRSKYYGEAVAMSYPKSYIFRAAWMVGGGRGKDKKFIKIVMNKIDSGEGKIYASDDFYGSLTYAKDLVATVGTFLHFQLPFGLYHCAGLGFCTRYDIALEVVRLLKKDTEVFPVQGSFFQNDFPTPRTHNEMLNNTKDAVNIKQRHWKSILEDYILGDGWR